MSSPYISWGDSIETKFFSLTCLLTVVIISYFFALYLGGWASKTKTERGVFGCLAIGTLVALGVFYGTSLVISLPIALAGILGGNSFRESLTIVVFVPFWGTIPAIFLGLIYGLVLFVIDCVAISINLK